MSYNRIFAWAVLVFATTACGRDDVTGPPTASVEPSLNTGGTIKKRFDLATGDVEVDAFGLNHKYSFLAFGEPGAPVAEGTWQWTGRHPDATWTASGRVICMRVIDNVAHVSGIIEQTDAYWAQPPFNYAIWSVVDMGNKKKSAPDQSSLFGIAMTEAQARAHCVSDTFLFITPVTNGEIVVRPAKVKNAGEDEDGE